MARFKNLVRYILQAIIIGLLIWYFYQNRDALSYLLNINWQQIVWIILLDTTSFVIGSFINYSMIRRFNTQISFRDSFLLQYANNFLNKILPTIGGGAAFRAIYLKKKYQFPYSQFASTIAGLYVISFFSTSLIGIFCLSVIYSQFKVFNWVIFLAFTGIILVTLFIILFSPQIPTSSRRILKVLKSVVEGWKILKKDPKFIVIYAVLSIIFLLLSALQTYISYYALGIKTSLIPMLFLSTLGIIVAFLNFTPGAIGVKEGVFIFSANLVKIPGEVLVLGSLILRGISLFTTFIFGGISYLVLTRQVQRMDNNSVITVQDEKAP